MIYTNLFTWCASRSFQDFFSCVNITKGRCCFRFWFLCNANVLWVGKGFFRVKFVFSPELMLNELNQWLYHCVNDHMGSSFFSYAVSHTFYFNTCTLGFRYSRNVSGMIISSPFLIWMSYMGPDERTKAVVLLVSYWTIQSVNNSGFRVNHIDIAPRYI